MTTKHTGGASCASGLVLALFAAAGPLACSQDSVGEPTGAFVTPLSSTGTATRVDPGPTVPTAMSATPSTPIGPQAVGSAGQSEEPVILNEVYQGHPVQLRLIPNLPDRNEPPPVGMEGGAEPMPVPYSPPDSQCVIVHSSDFEVAKPVDEGAVREENP